MIEIRALYQRENKRNIHLTAETMGEEGLYSEIAIGVYKGPKDDEDCFADIYVGINEDGGSRVLITLDGDSYGDHKLAVYPERSGTDVLDFGNY